MVYFIPEANINKVWKTNLYDFVGTWLTVLFSKF